MSHVSIIFVHPTRSGTDLRGYPASPSLSAVLTLRVFTDISY
jgi:hypothetical protein